jgi:CPA2 family monovalent cation:H+ antiporter-2
MMLFTPLLAGVAGGAAGAAVPAALKGIGIVVFVVGGAKWLVPKALYQVARTRYREVFLLSIIVIGFGVAWLTNAAGLSLALGAFLAGLIISESEYSHQALASVLPFRDAFTSFFFVSIGMLLDVRVLVHRPLLIAGIAVAVLLAKSVIGCFAVLHLGLPLRNSILVGLALSQVGEFSFILSRTGMEHGLLSKDGYQIFLSVSILTMAAAPFVIGLSGRVADTVIRLPVWGRADPAGGRRRLTLGDVFSRLPLPGKRLRMSLSSAREVEIKDHLIVVGFGFNGRSLARAARIAKIPYVVVETNPETVLSESEKGEPIVYGDATQEARILVVAISDPAATRRITAVARRLHPDLSIIVRTRYVEEMKPLYELGANEVVPEEYETSVEIFSRVLKKYLLSQDEIEQFISGLRSDGYQMLRRLFKEETDAERFELQLPGFEISVFRIGENSPLVGKSLATGDLRKKRGVNLLAIRRDGEVIPNPGGDAVLRAGDMLVLLGKPEQLAEVAGLF